MAVTSREETVDILIANNLVNKGHTSYWTGDGASFVLRDGVIGVEFSSAGAIIRTKKGDGSAKWSALSDFTTT